jgi:hypothetical protein
VKGAIRLNEQIPGWGVWLETEVENLQAAFEKHVEDNRQTHKDLYGRTERPSWGVTWALTVMGTILGGLLIWAVTHPPV